MRTLQMIFTWGVFFTVLVIEFIISHFYNFISPLFFYSLHLMGVVNILIIRNILLAYNKYNRKKVIIIFNILILLTPLIPAFNLFLASLYDDYISTLMLISPIFFVILQISFIYLLTVSTKKADKDKTKDQLIGGIDTPIKDLIVLIPSAILFSIALFYLTEWAIANHLDYF